MKNLDLRFTYVESAEIAILLALAVLAFTFFFYRRAFRGRFTWLPLALALLRAAAGVTCLFILLRPVVSFDLISKKKSRIAILIDRSLSMGIQDSVGGEARLASALRVARGELMARLGEIYHLEAYAFPREESLSPEAIPDLTADGSRTDLEAAWQGIRSSSEKLEAVILLSDGRDNHPERFQGNERLPASPIYPVALGSGLETTPDLAVTHVESEGKVLLGNRVEVRVGIRSRGLPELTTELSIHLLGEKGGEVLRKEVRLLPGANQVRFFMTPGRAGALTYQARLTEGPNELFRKNNLRHFAMDVAERLIQVLLFEGRVRWEYKFIRDTLARDPNVNITGIVKTRGDRVMQQGVAPVDLTEGFPKTREDLRKFDCVILGDVGSADFPPGVLELLKVWMGEDGGGLIYLGGPTTYGEIAASPLAGILPVQLRSGNKLPGKPAVKLALAAVDHPILRGIANYFLPEFPGGPFTLHEAFEAGSLRPGADPLLFVQSGQESDTPPSENTPETQVLLAAQQYGRGRAIAYLTDSDWRWVMLRGGEGGRALHGRLWGQMVRWAARRLEAIPSGTIAVHLPRRVAMAGERVRVEVRGSEDRLGKLQVVSVEPGGKLSLVPGSAEGNLWSGEFTPKEEGRYEIRADAIFVSAGSSSKKSVSSDSAALIVEPSQLEMDELLPNWDLLRTFAERTGGTFFSLPQVGGLADAIIQDTGGVVTHVELGTERSWKLYLIIIALFTLEWALRRKIFVV